MCVQPASASTGWKSQRDIYHASARCRGTPIYIYICENLSKNEKILKFGKHIHTYVKNIKDYKKWLKKVYLKKLKMLQTFLKSNKI